VGPGEADTGPGTAHSTPKEEFDAVTGPDRTWWRYCQELVGGQPGGEGADTRLGQLSAAEERLRDLGAGQASSPDASRAFTAAVHMIAELARVLAGRAGTPDGELPDVVPAIRFWARSGLLAPWPGGHRTPPRDESLPLVAPSLREPIRALAGALDGRRADVSQAMVLLTALRLAGLQPRRGRVTRVPVLFDKPGSTEGAAGMLEIHGIPGLPAGLYPDPEAMSFVRADEEFAGALASAWSFAIRGRGADTCVVWRLVLSDGAAILSLRGASLGAAFAIALREHFRKQLSLRRPWQPVRAAFLGLRPRCAITGAIAADDTLAPVGSMTAKFEAARAANWRLVAPAENRDASVHVPDGLHVYWAATLREASRYARRWRPVRLGLAVVMIALITAVSTTVSLSRQVSSEQSSAAASRLIADSGTQSGSDPVLSRLEAVAAWQLAPSAPARLAMLSAATQPEVAVLSGTADVIRSVAFSPDGRLLAAASGNEGSASGGVQLWNVQTREKAGFLPTRASSGAGNGVGPVAFSPDGKILALGTDDGTVLLWDVASRRRIGELATGMHGDGATVTLLAFSPDGKRLAVADYGGAMQVWEVPARQRLGSTLRLASTTAQIAAMAFSPDGKSIATVTPDIAAKGTEEFSAPGILATWSVATDREIGAAVSLTGTSYPDRGQVAFSPDGETLAVGDHGSQLWNVAARRPIATLPKLPPITFPQIGPVAFSADGKLLATNGGNTGTQIWDTASRQVIAVLPPGRDLVTAMALSPDGKLLATASGGTTQLWDVARASPFTAGEAVDSLAFSAAGKMLAATVPDHPGWVRLWSMTTGQPAGELAFADASGVGSAVFSPDGDVLVVAYNDGTARLWDVATLRPMGNPLPYGGKYAPYEHATEFAFSPDGRTLLTGYLPGRAQLWNVATQSLIANLPVSDSTTAVAFSPDGKTLAVASAGGVHLWNTASRRSAGVLVSSVGSPESLAFSASGKILAAGYDDGYARLWSVSSQLEIGAPVALTAVYDQISVLVLSPDGMTLAIGSGDGVVQLMDVSTGQPIGEPLITANNTWTVQFLAFSPDGKTLITGTTGGTELWNVGYLGSPVPYLCEQAGPPLTPSAWARSVPGVAYQDVCR